MTRQYRIEGEIHVVAGGRLVDELNKERDFIPLTNVTVFDVVGGNPIDTVEFVAVNKDAVVFLAPTAPGGPEGYGL
jgi:hypothetical protein